MISGSIVGSGELILTSSLGAAAGFVLLWWMLVCCWSKSIVQAELARYIVASGDTYLRALNRVPGRLPGPRGPVSWTLWFGLLSFLPGIIGMGGILGGTGQAMSLFLPGIDSRWMSALAAIAASAILYSGSYLRLEWTMLALVAGFTLATVASAIAMQFTEYGLSWSDVAAGFSFEFPAEHLVLALAVYGATGVNSAEISTYGYWCIEKGYAGFVGGDREDPAWLSRARGWIGVLQLDVWVTLAILTCATLPFYLLGAGVLHAAGLRPQGLETVSALSAMFTRTLGGWSLWLFGGAAFCILFSSVVAGFGGISRMVPDYLVEFGFIDRQRLATRIYWTRGCGAVLPVASLVFYLAIPNPVVLLMVGALMGALLLPVQSGATLWLQRYRMDPHLRPFAPAHALLQLTFLFQAVMATLVIAYVVL
ncbi:MAG: Nramp family divalent metal transporter [Gammaproteobacteria bacterium]|nr:Nramp family divalent metal transporter [Gammaproteobacteria bacterium]